MWYRALGLFQQNKYAMYSTLTNSDNKRNVLWFVRNEER